MNPHCRIGRVRLKAHPEVRVIVGSRADNPLHDRLQRQARLIAEKLPGMCGYAVVAWEADGTFSRATATTKAWPVGQTMLPSFVADVLRRDTMRDVADDAS
jgi:hypothetical protein